VVLKAWCELRTGKTPHPSDLAEERRRPCRARWGHDLSMSRLLEKPGPALYSPECVEVEFSEVRRHGVLGSSLVKCSPKVGLMLTVAVMLVDGPLALLVGLTPG
jgi:hypothetical protein